MPRPEIVCHMATSLDGRLLPERWGLAEDHLLEVYETAAQAYDADGWIVGSQTMAAYIPASRPALGPQPVPRADAIAGHGGRQLGICFDRSARLRPESGDVDGDHLVLVLGERAEGGHVEQLVRRGVSVVFAGADGNDIAGALSRIAAAFGAQRLLLEGGGRINGAFLEAGLIDETSTLVFPVIDGQREVPAIYDRAGEGAATQLELVAVEAVAGGASWLRHKVSRR